MKIENVYKRDGTLEKYDRKKIANAIFKAAVACGGNDKETSNNLAKQVEDELKKYNPKENHSSLNHGTKNSITKYAIKRTIISINKFCSFFI